MPTIRLENVSKHYGPTKAADRLSLEIMDGEYLCILGPTGAGKTTLLRILSGLTLPDSGKVFFDGADRTRAEPEERGASMLSQTYSLFPALTVSENILFGPAIRGMGEKDKDDTLNSMLDLVRLTERSDAYPKELSGGMMQRTALARALASGCDTLLLDEPLRALDARLRISLRYEIRDLAKSLGLTTIHVTHDQDEALVMADRIAIIRHGTILQVGTPNDVFDHPNSPFVANFVGQCNFFRGKVLSSGSITQVQCADGRSIEAGPSELKAGEEAVVAVKLGNTELTKEAKGYFSGTVERTLFEGKYIHVDVNVKDVGTISAKLPSWRLSKLAIGDQVDVRWNAARANVFPMPEGGLEQELKVE
ncbi:MAG: Trehalose/maltose import ATP-binding protein MalK [Methanomassiliicoccales archaeon PtaU1.Bin124]|nr:MAG: Trehalose/maltose import ATP-binding protein MalK [Methanomassiliicoccales archaeon PtaU1.Bin124]